MELFHPQFTQNKTKAEKNQRIQLLLGQLKKPTKNKKTSGEFRVVKTFWQHQTLVKQKRHTNRRLCSSFTCKLLLDEGLQVLKDVLSDTHLRLIRGKVLYGDADRTRRVSTHTHTMFYLYCPLRWCAGSRIIRLIKLRGLRQAAPG